MFMLKQHTAPTLGERETRAPPLPLSLSPRVGAGVGVRVGLGLGLVYLVLEHEVFREARIRSRDKILCSDWSPPLLVEELACRHVGQDKLFFKKRCLVCQKLHVDTSE